MPKENQSTELENTAIQFETSNNTSKENSGKPNSEPGIDDKKNTDNPIKTESIKEQQPDPELDSKLDPKPDLKPNPKPDPKPDLKPEPKPDPEPDLKPVPKPDPKPDQKPEPKPTSKTHKVGSNENLYRISLKYYNSGDGVNKIKQANGLSSNEIVVGQTLIIP